MVLYVFQLILKVYTLFLFLRVMGSWFPSFREMKWMQFLVYYTDPYLNLFRRIIPPVGGVIDLSPLVGFFVLKFLENALVRIFL